MNYRHAFHAGSFSDVFKHAILALLVETLKAKDKPFFYLDTHAGLARYDLFSEEARRGGEFRHGILRLLDAPRSPAVLAPYLAALAAAAKGEGGARRWYPGSSRIVRELARPDDRLVLTELHPEDQARLAVDYAGDRQVTVRHLDGFSALKAFLPPTERRGLVLIDPAFEKADELARMERGLRHALRRWPTGIYALWYPIKDRGPIAQFHKSLAASGMKKVLAAELLLHPDDDATRLNGCGMVIVNPPWRFDTALAELVPWLHSVLRQRERGAATVAWLVKESAGRPISVEGLGDRTPGDV